MGTFKTPGRAGKGKKGKGKGKGKSKALDAAAAAVAAGTHEPCSEGQVEEVHLPETDTESEEGEGPLVVRLEVDAESGVHKREADAAGGAPAPGKKPRKKKVTVRDQLEGFDPRSGRMTCDGGLLVNWVADMADGTRIKARSMRDLVIKLDAAGVPVKGFEAVRTFLTRRASGDTNALPQSYEMFSGVKSIAKWPTLETNLLAGQGAALKRLEARENYRRAKEQIRAEYAAALAACAEAEHEAAAPSTYAGDDLAV